MRRLPSGNLVVQGRTKDMINRGGEKISAEEVESVVLSHPGVLNVAAVAMPDRDMGERTCVYVVCREGQSLQVDELCAYLLEKAADRQVQAAGAPRDRRRATTHQGWEGR